jgi:hypothetical protein
MFLSLSLFTRFLCCRYDNEMGYSSRVCDLVQHMSQVGARK